MEKQNELPILQIVWRNQEPIKFIRPTAHSSYEAFMTRPCEQRSLRSS